MRKIIDKENECASIIVVEDNPDHAELITESIKEANILNKVFWFDNGPEALKFINKEGEYQDESKFPSPALIMLDLRLPDMSGKEILQQLKSDENTKTIPVVVLTSSGQDQDIEDCYKLGANSYITKPISFGDFIEKVKSIPMYWMLLNALPKR
jgi:CheY-like chemotaxis protein